MTAIVVTTSAIGLAAPITPAHAEPTSCVHFTDYQGKGQAFSLPSGAQIFNGEYMQQVKTSQAWRFCFPFSAGHGLLRLKADQSYCVSGYKHVARIFKCSSSGNQQWKQRKHRSPFYFRLLNRNGVMCAAGNGVNYADVVEQCSGGATQWVTG